MKKLNKLLLAFLLPAAALLNSCDKELSDASSSPEQSSGTLAEQDSLPVAAVVAGTVDSGYKDGPALEARFSPIIDVATRSNGEVYIMESSRIRKLKNGVVSTVAGTGVPGYKNGPAETAQFNDLRSIGVCKDGTVYVIDKGSNSIRKITPNGTVSTYAGGPVSSTPPVVQERTYDLKYLTVADDGSVYFTETGSVNPETEEYLFAIRKISPQGVYSTIEEGRAFAFNSVDEFEDVEIDANDNLFSWLRGRAFNGIFKVAPDGTRRNVYSVFFIFGPSYLTVNSGGELYFTGPKDVIYAPYPSSEDDAAEPEIVAIVGDDFDDFAGQEEEERDGKDIRGMDAFGNDFYVGYGSQLKKVTLP